MKIIIKWHVARACVIRNDVAGNYTGGNVFSSCVREIYSFYFAVGRDVRSGRWWLKHNCWRIPFCLLFQLLGGACFSHGPYTFYKAVRISNGRVLRLGSFFLTKLWSDADLVSIGELQLLWMDSRGPNQPLASLRLYFLPENTPDGRRDTHGEVRFPKSI